MQSRLSELSRADCAKQAKRPIECQVRLSATLIYWDDSAKLVSLIPAAKRILEEKDHTYATGETYSSPEKMKFPYNPNCMLRKSRGNEESQQE